MSDTHADDNPELGHSDFGDEPTPKLSTGPRWLPVASITLSSISVLLLIATFAFSIGSGMLAFALLLGIAGLVSGHVGLSLISQGRISGRGLALAGTILGWVSAGLGIVSQIIAIILLLLGVTYGIGIFAIVVDLLGRLTN